MAICAVCQAPCRGKCAKCGARLCTLHKPLSARARCVICKRLGTSTTQAVQAIPPYSTSAPHASPSTMPDSSTVPLATRTLADQITWIELRCAQLLKKQARERAYLGRRAVRGTHTPTDDAYEADSILETELLEALDLLAQCLQGRFPLSASLGSSSTYAGDTSMLFPVPGPHDKLQP